MADKVSISIGKSRILTGLICALVCAYYLHLSFGLPWGRMSAPRSGVFPVFVGFILMIACIIVIVDGFLMLRRDRYFDIPTDHHLTQMSLIFGALVFYAAALPWLGHLLASFVMSAVALRMLSTMHWVKVILSAAVLAGVVYLLFTHLLFVPLPRGVVLRF